MLSPAQQASGFKETYPYMDLTIWRQLKDELTIVIAHWDYSVSGCPGCHCGVQSGNGCDFDGIARVVECANKPRCRMLFGVAFRQPHEVVEIEGRTYVVTPHPEPHIKRHTSILAPDSDWTKMIFR